MKQIHDDAETRAKSNETVTETKNETENSGERAKPKKEDGWLLFLKGFFNMF